MTGHGTRPAGLDLELRRLGYDPNGLGPAGEGSSPELIGPVPAAAIPLLVAALEAGYMVAVLPGSTPIRALVGGLGLGAGAVAALIVGLPVFVRLVRGSWLRKCAAGLVVLSLLGGPAIGLSGLRLSDPTQAQPADLSLSVTCTRSEEYQLLRARVEFSWSRTDLWPSGIGRDPGLDAVVIYPSDPWAGPGAPVDGPAYRWNNLAGPYGLTIDGRPDANFGTDDDAQWYVAHYSERIPGAQQGGYLRVSEAALQPHRVYSASWTFGLSRALTETEFSMPSRAVIVVEYDHGRFVRQAFGACSSPAKTQT